MRRHFESLRPADRSAIEPSQMDYSSSRLIECSIAGTCRNLITRSASRFSSQTSRRLLDHWPPLLHRQSDVEIELVPARLRLRHRTAG